MDIYTIMFIKILLTGVSGNIEIILKDLENGNTLESGRTKRIKSVAEHFILNEDEVTQNIKDVISVFRPKPNK